METYREQTPTEEKLNALTHGIGIILILVGAPFLIIDCAFLEGGWPVTTVSIFTGGMLLCYLSSTLYHMVTHHGHKRKLQIFDHISIFLLIGGTYTPVIYLYTPAVWSIPFLSTMWGIILLGIIYKLFFTGRYAWFSLILYLSLGWMVVIVAYPLYNHMPLDIFLWILGGGLAYTLGTYFYQLDKKYYHSIWHLFVMTGTVLHFIAIYIGMMAM